MFKNQNWVKKSEGQLWTPYVFSKCFQLKITQTSSNNGNWKPESRMGFRHLIWGSDLISGLSPGLVISICQIVSLFWFLSHHKSAARAILPFPTHPEPICTSLLTPHWSKLYLASHPWTNYWCQSQVPKPFNWNSLNQVLGSQPWWTLHHIMKYFAEIKSSILQEYSVWGNIHKT